MKRVKMKKREHEKRQNETCQDSRVSSRYKRATRVVQRDYDFVNESEV